MGKKQLLLIANMFVGFLGLAQVGIGTTTPNASLDINASNQAAPSSNDGLLIPRVDEFPTILPGVNQDGMLVYVTGSGAASRGFYFWDNDNTQWSPFLANTNSDFYEEGTTVAAANTTDDIYRMGNVAIGKNTADAYLDIEHSLAAGNGLLITSSSTDYGIKHHIYNDIATSGSGTQYAMYNDFNGVNTYSKYGVYNDYSDISGVKYGIYNNHMGSESGGFTGVYNRASNSSSSTKYGVYNYLTSFSGGAYGVRNQLTPSSSNSSTVYGSYNYVSSSGTGVHYGVYASAYGDANRAIYGSNSHSTGYAGYFQGRGYFYGDVGIGINAINPLYQLDVRDAISSNYVTQIYNTSTTTNAHGVKVRLGNTSPNTTNYYIGFFDGADTVNGRIQGTGVGVSYQTLSDKRLKTNINEVENALETITKIEPKLYEFKELKGKQEMGFLAQDLQLVFPQAVSGNPNSDVTKNPMMVDYSRLTPLLTAGIKELNAKVEVLEKENKELKKLLSKYQDLDKRLVVIEKR